MIDFQISVSDFQIFVSFQKKNLYHSTFLLVIFKFRGPFSRSGKKTRRIGKGYAILAQPKWIPIFWANLHDECQKPLKIDFYDPQILSEKYEPDASHDATP